MFPWSSITHPHIDQSSDMLYIEGLVPIPQSDIPFFDIGATMSVFWDPEAEYVIGLFF